MIIKTRNPEEIQRRKKSIADGLARISWGDEEAWTIRASVGCAKYDKEAMHGIEEWFQAADQQMYEQKKREV